MHELSTLDLALKRAPTELRAYLARRTPHERARCLAEILARNPDRTMLAAEAGLDVSTLWRAARRRDVMPATLTRLIRAHARLVQLGTGGDRTLKGELDRLRAAARGNDDDTQRVLIRCAFYVFLAAARAAIAVGGSSGAGKQPRPIALYLTVTALGLRGVDVARAVGVTPAAVSIACASCEDRRDVAAFDRLLDCAAGVVMGGT